MVRTGLRMVGLTMALYFGVELVLLIVPAGADISTQANLADRAALYRSMARTTLGPFDLGNPRLVAATCSEDGHTALLTYEAPITAERTTLSIDVRSSGTLRSDGTIEGGGEVMTRLPESSATSPAPTDPAWCGRVPPMFKAQRP